MHRARRRKAIPWPHPQFLDGSLPSDWSKFYDEVRTYRSTNNGALWSLLTMTGQSDPDDGEPERPNFVHDACNACDPSKGACSLHLHFGSSWIFYDHPPLYSHWSAPGLLMATGNYGNSLDFSGESLCTYLSRDAGQTWQDVAMGPWMYEFGDHGGVIVIGKHRSQGLATELRFSLDFGTSWQSIKLRTPMYLENIRLEPGGRADVFVAYGTTCKASEHPVRCIDDPVPLSRRAQVERQCV